MGGVRFIIMAFVSIAMVHACDQSGKNDSTPTPRGTGTQTGTGARASTALTDPVTYDSWVKDYLTKNCTSCHSTQGGIEPDLASYGKAKLNAQEALGTMMDGSMPKGGPKASKDQVNKMQAWITGGTLEKKPASAGTQTTPRTGSGNGSAPNPGTNPAPGASAPPAVGLTWTRDIQPIFRSSCGIASNGCHSSQSSYGDLSSLDAAKRRVPGIRTSVSSGLMPRGSRLAEADKRKIIDWTNQGAN
jgi:hypothetical protein